MAATTVTVTCNDKCRVTIDGKSWCSQRTKSKTANLTAGNHVLHYYFEGSVGDTINISAQQGGNGVFPPINDTIPANYNNWGATYYFTSV